MRDFRRNDECVRGLLRNDECGALRTNDYTRQHVTGGAATAAATDAHLLTAVRDFDHLSPHFIKLERTDRHTGAVL
jgi:hypothetical protein